MLTKNYNTASHVNLMTLYQKNHDYVTKMYCPKKISYQTAQNLIDEVSRLKYLIGENDFLILRG
jgi:hypothetical protein